jgi:glycosyltransferase involved in cell wall biosynthesis
MGGPSVVAYNLIREFNKKGVQVDFVFGISKEHLSKTSNLSNLFGFSDNINLIPIVKNERSPESYKTSPDSKFLKDISTLSRKINKEFDLIHFHSFPRTRDIFVPFLARLKNIPTICREGGWITYETFTEKRDDSRALVYYDYFTFMFLKRFFTKVVCNSFYLKQKLVSDGLFKAEKIEVIPNGVDNEKFRNAKEINLDGDPALLFVGRLEYIKGVDILVKSMKGIIKELPNATLHIVGDGTLMRQLKSFVISNGLETRVIFHGRISQNLPSFYKSADICVFPSRFDIAPNAILEAMSAGKPIIASKIGGIPEIIKSFENGILINLRVSDLVNSVITLSNDSNLLNKICQKNMLKIQNYSWSKMAEDYINLYRSIM